MLTPKEAEELAAKLGALEPDPATLPPDAHKYNTLEKRMQGHAGDGDVMSADGKVKSHTAPPGASVYSGAVVDVDAGELAELDAAVDVRQDGTVRCTVRGGTADGLLEVELYGGAAVRVWVIPPAAVLRVVEGPDP